MGHLEKIPAFLEVVKHQSMRKAATEMRITQPALSRSIQILEDAVGKKLLKRSSRGVKPTTEGLILFQFAQNLHGWVETLENNLNTSLFAMKGKIIVGTYESIAIYFWPRVLKEIRRIAPHFEIILQTDLSDRLHKKLITGDLDVIVSVNPDSNRKIESTELYRDFFSLYQQSGLELSQRTPILFSPYALERTGVNPSELLKSMQLHQRTRFEFQSFEVILNLTAQGLGIGMLPNRVAKQFVSEGKLRPFFQRKHESTLSSFGEHRICISRLKSKTEDLRIDNIIRICRET